MSLRSPGALGIIYLWGGLPEHRMTTIYIIYRSLRRHLHFWNGLKINIEFSNQNYEKWLNSNYLSHKVFLGTTSSSSSHPGLVHQLFLFTTAVPAGAAVPTLHAAAYEETTFIMAAEIPPRLSKKYHLWFSEYQNIPENLVPIKNHIRNSILYFLIVLEHQMTL